MPHQNKYYKGPRKSAAYKKATAKEKGKKKGGSFKSFIGQG
mgnify:CR=1 FL=1